MQVKRYYFLGGPPRFSFIDSTWVEFSGLAADTDLNVYVSDATRDRVDKYDQDGQWVRKVTGYGTGQGYVIDPQGIAYTKGALWVSTIGPSRSWVQRLRPDTTFIAFEGRPIGLDIELSKPSDVATNLSGESVFFPEAGKNRVMRFQATGAFEDTVYAPTKRETIVDPPITAPRYLSADDSLVFVADSANSRIVVLRLSKQ
jgi:DNA-binding beta-propeller fold protein YncE